MLIYNMYEVLLLKKKLETLYKANMDINDSHSLVTSRNQSATNIMLQAMNNDFFKREARK